MRGSGISLLCLGKLWFVISRMALGSGHLLRPGGFPVGRFWRKTR